MNDYSVAISELVSFSLLKYYRDSLVIESAISVAELDNDDLTKYDCIISTVHIPQKVPIPVIRISPMVVDKDLDRLNAYLHLNAIKPIKDFIQKDRIYNISVTNKEQILKQMCAKEKILKKERKLIPGFELKQQLAIHYMICPGQKSEISIYNLSKSVVWKHQLVKTVFFLKLGEDSEAMIESFTYFLGKEHDYEFLENLFD